MGKIVVIGSSNTDMVVRSSKMPAPGETVLGNEFDVIPGGKGANQAVAAARAGGEVTFITKVGNDDFGKKAIAGYQKDKINTEHILVDQEAPSGVALIIVDDSTGQNTIVVAPGANAKLSEEDIQQMEAIIKEADIVLLQLETSIEAVFMALKMAKANGIKTILNPAPAQALSDELLSFVDIITPNESETEILIGIHPEEKEEIIKASDILLEKVNDSVIITLGSKGVYFASKNGDNDFVPTTKVDAIDTTAAGDVFNGYLATALSSGRPLLEAIQQANRAAAISVTRRGAQPSVPFKNEI